MWASIIAKIGNFCYKYAVKGYTPLSDFLNIKFGLERESQVRTFMPNFIVLALKCGPTASKIAIFGINLPLRENLGDPQKKLNIGAQLQTFLYAMTP